MRCVTCGVELIAGKKFCHACGAPVGASCRGCGAALEASFRFCPDCGLKTDTEELDGPPPDVVDPLTRVLAQRSGRQAVRSWSPTPSLIEGERKQVTVLFCDLVGSIAIAERLDPEEYHDLLEDYLDLVFPEIYRREGIVNQLAGDGLMALFGAPVAHEDAPQRAVHAALAHPRRPRAARPPACRRARHPARDPHRHQHRPGGRRAGRQRPQDGLHGDRRHDEPGLAAPVAGAARGHPDQRVDAPPGARLLRRRARSVRSACTARASRSPPTRCTDWRGRDHQDRASPRSAASRRSSAARTSSPAGRGLRPARRRAARRWWPSSATPAAASRACSTSSATGSKAHDGGVLRGPLHLDAAGAAVPPLHGHDGTLLRSRLGRDGGRCRAPRSPRSSASTTRTSSARIRSSAASSRCPSSSSPSSPPTSSGARPSTPSRGSCSPRRRRVRWS